MKVKKYRFIELNGEDYMLKGMNGAEDRYIRAYYKYDIKKTLEETKTIRTYNFTDK